MSNQINNNVSIESIMFNVDYTRYLLQQNVDITRYFQQQKKN